MTYTPFLRLNKPPFGQVPWDEAINGDLDILDGFIAQYMAVPNFTGSWTNSTPYIVGQVTLDTTTSSMWRAEVSHTSSALPTTFAQERVAHPTYWFETTSPQGSLAITGGTMLGPITLAGDPTDPLHAATKQYVDAGVRSFNGRTGAITLGSVDVTNALGYTPYNSGNPANYQTSAQVVAYVSAALGPYFPASTTDARYVFKSGDTITGGLNVNGNFGAGGNAYVGNTLTVNNSIINSTGLFQIAPNYYLQRGGDGAWRFVEGGNVNSTLDAAGNMSVRGQFVAATSLFARGGTAKFGGGAAGDNVVLQFEPNWYWDWGYASGQITWITPIGGTFGQRIIPDHLTFNLQGTFGGYGPFIDLSDGRAKQAVAPTTRGLAEVLQLNPVSFQRVMPDGSVRTDEEIGLIAQEVASIVPEVVTDLGFPLAGGAGTFESGTPSQGIAYAPLIVVLINAIKELTARIETLEAP